MTHDPQPSIAVLGSGSWGTALAVLLGKKGYSITLWGIPEEAEAIARDGENARYLPGVKLPPTVTTTSDIGEAVADRKAVVVAIPSTGVREVAKLLKNRLSAETILINAGKGLESDTGLRGSQVIREEIGEGIGRNCVALSGPNLAVELAHDIPTATVVACPDLDRAAAAQEIMSAPSLRVYRNADRAGVELGGALKNVLAIGAGVSDGLGYGDNTKATLVTRGLMEMTRLGVILGAAPRTLMGLSGMGDLMATCASRLSRNLRLGLMMGQGRTLDESLKELGQVAEGMHTCEAAFLLSRKHNVYMPITEEVHAILFQGKHPKQAVHDLMSRDHKEEF